MTQLTTIRPAQTTDLPKIVSIYNEAIKEGGFTADLHPYTVDEKREWFQQVSSEKYGIFVLLHQSEVVGYFYFTPWRGGRVALQSVAELSFYLASHARGRGYGKLMVSESVKMAEAKGFEHLMAIMLDVNERSRGLLENFGFTVVGTLPGIAKIQQGICGQYIMLKS